MSVTRGIAAVAACLAIAALTAGCGSDSSPNAEGTPSASSSALPASSPLKMTEVASVSVAAPTSKPNHQTGDAGELWAWSGSGSDGQGLISVLVAKRHTNIPTQQGVDGELLTQVESAKDAMGKPEATKLDADVPGAKASAATQLDGILKGGGIPERQVLVMFTDGDKTMYLVRIDALRTKAGKEIADQIVGSLRLNQ